MGNYLNPDSENFFQYKNARIFVDKSMLIKETNAVLRSKDAFMCVTRPRRFGKTLALSMLNAYYSKGCDSRELFKGLKICKDPSFEEHLNKHNVISIDMAAAYVDSADKSKFLAELTSDVIRELNEAFPNCLTPFDLTLRKAIAKINGATGERFIFLIDEWDVVYREQEHNRALCDGYTEFLRSLFKSSDASPCLDLVYMTGILPIRRYSTQSTLNMFTEYNMLEPRSLSPFFGFTEEETKALCERYGRDFGEIKSWYDGYRLDGIEIYNPKSVVEAVESGKCKDYWTRTSSIEAVTDYMNYDHGALKATITRLLSGESQPLDADLFRNDLTMVNSGDAALTVLIHLGYLGYDPDTSSCYVPNREIAEELVRATREIKWGSIYDPISNSERLYERTLAGDTDFINATFDRNHSELSSMFTKNNEQTLFFVASISYYKLRYVYNIKAEETSINGRSDISFVPRDSEHTPMIIELKKDAAPEEAIDQIKSRRYWEAWGSESKGKILLLGISYDSKTMKHCSKIEYIEIGK